MADQYQLFTGEELKIAGLKKVAENNMEYVRNARDHARKIAAMTGYVCSDNIHDVYPPPPWAHPSVMGAVFAHPMFVFFKYIKSRRPSAHGRMIRLYHVAETGK